MSTKPIEERIYERLNLPINLNYEVATRPRQQNKAFTKNISGGGTCLSLPEKLLPETRLNINVSLDDVGSEAYSLNGKVVWTRIANALAADEFPDNYDTGVQFTTQDPVTIGRIVSFFHAKKV